MVTPGRSRGSDSKHLIVQVDVSSLDQDQIFIARGGVMERLVVLQVDRV